MKVLSLIDVIMGPLVFGLILLHAFVYKKRKEIKDPSYVYFFKGAILKMLGSIGFCAIYLFYFEGGDTHDYHQNAVALVNMLFDNSSHWWDVMWSSNLEYWSYFNENTGMPIERHFLDTQTFNVSRILTFIELICFKSYLGSCFLMSYLSYMGLWKIYRVFTHYFQDARQMLFYTTLAIPSVLFWSGGLSKEVIVIPMLGLAVWSIFQLFVVHKRSRLNAVILLLTVYTIISIKPYVFIALLPSAMVWLSISRIGKIKNLAIRILAFPMVILFGIAISYTLWISLSSSFGDYGSINGMISKAVVSQQDLQHERYAGSSFDIGVFEPTINGALSMFPEATVAGLFRPYILEANNAVMLFSGLENLILMLLCMRALVKPRLSLSRLISSGFLSFCIIFTIIFGFAIGLSTSNFGALVRFKMPLLPFFAGTVYILGTKLKQKT